MFFGLPKARRMMKKSINLSEKIVFRGDFATPLQANPA